MSQVPEDRIFSPFYTDKVTGITFKMPFYYDAVSFIWNYFKVPRDKVEPHLEGTGLCAAQFSDLGSKEVIVSLNFQNYLSNLGMVLSHVLEVEFNIHAFPLSKKGETPLISFEDYILGLEQTKWIGGLRLHVPADDPVAVEAGRGVFGEQKFLMNFAFNIPVPNNPAQEKWTYTTFDPDYKPDPKKTPKPANIIYSMVGDLNALPCQIVSNQSPLTLYSLLPGGPDHPPGYGKLNASRWNILGLDQTWLNVDKMPSASVKVTYGASKHPMRTDMQKIIGDTEACCVRYYQPPPAAIENRAFWVEPLKPGEKPPAPMKPPKKR